MVSDASVRLGNLRVLTTHVAMRDGVRLATDVYVGPTDIPRPCLVIRTPYGRRFQVAETYAHPGWYVSRGFVVVCQDTRGRGDSEGEFRPFETEAEDGFDTLAWVASQPFCDGSIGTYGFSYPGAVQLDAASLAPPQLRAMAPAMTAADIGTGWMYRNGALNLSWVLSWSAELGRATALRVHDLDAAGTFGDLLSQPSQLVGALPVGSCFSPGLSEHVEYLADWLGHAPGDDYWRRLSPAAELKTSVPSLFIAGWYDVFLESTLRAFERLDSQGCPARLMVGPWWHTPWGRFVGDEDFSEEAGNVIDEAQVRFFAHFLAGEANGVEGEPPVRLFVMGENDWRSFEHWPPSTSRVETLYFHSDGRSNSLNGTGRLDTCPPTADEEMDLLASDPVFPVSPAGGRSCCYPEISPMGPADQRGHEIRNDVLVYDSQPLEADLLVIGSPTASLWVAADRESADLVARLVDVSQDGRAVNVSDANARLAFEVGGPPKEVRLSFSPTAVLFRRGHRIRVDVMETSFPLFDRNPHCKVSPLQATLADFDSVTMAFARSPTSCSSLGLPVVDRETV